MSFKTSKCCCDVPPFCNLLGELAYSDDFESPQIDSGWNQGNWSVATGRLRRGTIGHASPRCYRVASFDPVLHSTAHLEVNAYDSTSFPTVGRIGIEFNSPQTAILPYLVRDKDSISPGWTTLNGPVPNPTGKFPPGRRLRVEFSVVSFSHDAGVGDLVIDWIASSNSIVVDSGQQHYPTISINDLCIIQPTIWATFGDMSFDNFDFQVS